jgi:hypothetical protein
LALGFGGDETAPEAAGGAGGVPFAPGIGSALAFGTVWFCGNALGDTFAGTSVVGAAFCPFGTPGAAGLAAGLIEALGGSGSFPCWISEAFCAAAAGSAGPALAGAVPTAFAPGDGGAVPGAAGVAGAG